MSKETIITSKNQLIQYISDGFKSTQNSSVGIEFESFLYQKNDFTPIAYHSTHKHAGIADLLDGFDKSKWQKIMENHNAMGLESNIGNISLEPAGQFEFSSIPAKNIIELNNLTQSYFNEALPLLNKLNIGIYNLGYNPIYTKNQLQLMPKQRYDIMYNYMPKVGSLGQQMMKATTTVQTNLDYSSEADLAKKFRLSMALSPFITALFANSPFYENKISPYLSHRMNIWQDTDNKRSGLLKIAFEDNFSIEKYVDYALDVPMYFIYRDNKYVNISNITFKDYLIGTYKFNNNKPLLEDFVLHLSTLFPDVRLKNYLEIRSADCVDKDYLVSLSALFVGLFYNPTALNHAYDLIKEYSFEDINTLKKEVITKGIHAQIKNTPIKTILAEILNTSYQALLSNKLGEEVFVSNLIELLNSNKTLAEQKLDLYKALNGDMLALIKKISM